MADQGQTLLTAARARKLALSIKDGAAARMVANAIPTIKREALAGSFSVAMVGEGWTGQSKVRSEAAAMLMALGFSVFCGNGHSRISW